MRGHVGRHGCQCKWIENCHVRRVHGCVTYRHFQVASGIRNHARAGNFRSRACRGGNCDAWQRSVLEFFDALIVVNASSIGGKNPDCLGHVHGAAATYGEDCGRSVFAANCKGAFDGRVAGIRLYVTECRSCNTLRLQDGLYALIEIAAEQCPIDGDEYAITLKCFEYRPELGVGAYA